MRRLLLTLKIMFSLNAARYGQIHGYSGSDQPPSDCRDNVRNIEWAVAKNYIFTNNQTGMVGTLHPTTCNSWLQHIKLPPEGWLTSQAGLGTRLSALIVLDRH